MSSSICKPLNLFTSLPSDLIREICCEWDTTYRYVFSSDTFRKELHDYIWNMSSVKDYCKHVIIRLLYDVQKSTPPRHCKWGTDWSLIYIKNGKCFSSQTKEPICLKTDVDFIWSVYGYFLRWKIVPKPFRPSAFRQKYCTDVYYDGFFASSILRSESTVQELNSVVWGHSNDGLDTDGILVVPSRLMKHNDIHSFVGYLWY